MGFDGNKKPYWFDLEEGETIEDAAKRLQELSARLLDNLLPEINCEAVGTAIQLGTPTIIYFGYPSAISFAKQEISETVNSDGTVTQKKKMIRPEMPRDRNMTYLFNLVQTDKLSFHNERINWFVNTDPLCH